MDVHPLDGVLAAREQRVPLGQEGFEAAFGAGLAQAAVACLEAGRTPCEQTLAGIPDVALVAMVHLHVRPVVRQVEENTRGGDGEGVRGIQRKKVHAGLVCMPVADVRAQVELGELPRAGNLREGPHADLVHPERNDADPGGAVEGVDHQAFRQQMRQIHGRNGPVRKQQVVPALGHDPRRLWHGPRTMFGGRQDPIHLPEARLPSENVGNKALLMVLAPGFLTKSTAVWPPAIWLEISLGFRVSIPACPPPQRRPAGTRTCRKPTIIRLKSLPFTALTPRSWPMAWRSIRARRS